MKQTIAILSILLISVISSHAADTLSDTIRECNTPECLARLRTDADKSFDHVSKRFDDDMNGVKEDILLSHCESLIEETFYHMAKVKAYHNYEDIYKLRKLRELKNNQSGYKDGISRSEFTRRNARAEQLYLTEMADAQTFIDEKVIRMRSLCLNLQQNLESLKTSNRFSGTQMDDLMRQRVLTMETRPVWQEFINETAEGQKIRKAILRASNDDGQALLGALTHLFDGFKVRDEKFVIDPLIVEQAAFLHPVI